MRPRVVDPARHPAPTRCAREAPTVRPGDPQTNQPVIDGRTGGYSAQAYERRPKPATCSTIARLHPRRLRGVKMSRQRWNSPPGWPQPPAGWAPQPGWVPDPTWPTPPADWTWWTSVPMPRRKRVAITVTVVVVGLLIAALLAADVVGSAKGCGSIDPGDPANFSAAVILNDTHARVTINDCRGSYCSGDATTVDLYPGQPLDVHAACGVSGAQMTSWRVGNVNGTTLGYIAVQTKRKHDGLVYPVSAASRDRQTPTPVK